MPFRLRIPTQPEVDRFPKRPLKTVFSRQIPYQTALAQHNVPSRESTKGSPSPREDDSFSPREHPVPCPWILKSFLIALLLAFVTPMGMAQTVWLDLDQTALDKAYDQAVYAPNLEQVLARFDSNSDLLRRQHGPPKRFSYGSDPNEALDVFSAKTIDAPIHIFIHGGAWKFGSAAQNAYLAETFTQAGVHFVIPDFSPVQAFDGDLMPMVQQLRNAILWIYDNASEKFGGNPERIYLSGFSSGGHLAGVLLTTNWGDIPGAPDNIIKGALLCSGMYDLTPVSLSYRREYVNFNPEVIESLSPIRHIGQVTCPVIVAYGSYETPEFKRQAIEFAGALIAQNVPTTLIQADGYNHFETIETMANPFGILGRVALNQIKPRL